MLGTSAEQDDEKHVQLLSLELAFATKVVSQAFDSHSRSPKPSRSIAMLGFLPGRRRDWSDLMWPRWDRRHFSASKNRQNSVTVHL